MVERTKWLYLGAGFVLVGLAMLGVVLPLLPTTPLLLLAAWCFANSSEKHHRWLLEHRLFGPLIQDWHNHRRIPQKAKVIAVVSIVLFGGYAIGFAIEHIAVRLAGAVVLLIGLIFVLRIPTSGK